MSDTHVTQGRRLSSAGLGAEGVVRELGLLVTVLDKRMSEYGRREAIDRHETYVADLGTWSSLNNGNASSHCG